MPRVVVDTNVFLSTFVQRNEEQRAVAKALLLKAEDGEVEVILPQFVVFEIAYVLQSTYRTPPSKLGQVLRDLIALPGVLVIDECPWERVLEFWPAPLSSLADAAIVALATGKRYDAVATFDQKLAHHAKNLGVATYF
ncbi:MAG TPA: PIN domain-containing protein [Thermoanaerobaculia bacterium]|nr:PIN domain-containing protein [Thermoanaerobaculia bacterium]